MGYKLIYIYITVLQILQLHATSVENSWNMLNHVEPCWHMLKQSTSKKSNQKVTQHINKRIKQTHEEKHTTNIKTPVFLGHRQALGARPGGLSNWAGDYGPVDPPGSDGRFTGSNCDSWGMLGEYEPKLFKFELNHGENVRIANVLQMCDHKHVYPILVILVENDWSMRIFTIFTESSPWDGDESHRIHRIQLDRSGKMILRWSLRCFQCFGSISNRRGA